MKNPPHKSHGFAEEENFEKVLATELKKDLRKLQNPKIAEPEAAEGLKAFVREVRPVLKDLYCKYKVPPRSVYMLATFTVCGPAPQEFPKQVRSRRKIEQTADLLEKASELVYKLDSASMYGFSLFSDPALDITLKAGAARVRKMKPMPGRPQRLIMKHFATVLAEMFRHYAGSPLYSDIAKLLKALYWKDWPAHGNEVDAVKKLIGGATLNDVFGGTDDALPEGQIRELARKYETNFDNAWNVTRREQFGIKATAYENHLKAVFKLVVGTSKKRRLLGEW
jgi:hypothetical protein